MNTIDKSSKPPTIPPSEMYNTNETRILKSSETLVNSMTDGIITFSGGTVSNLSRPLKPQQAATKKYVDLFLTRVGGPATPVGTVQFASDITSEWPGTDVSLVGLAYPTDIIWSAELEIFVACGIQSFSPPPTLGGFATSLDGISWTTIIFEYAFWKSIAWSPELGIFSAVGQSVTGVGATSSDSLFWVSRTVPTYAFWNSVIWESTKNLFIAVGGDNSGISSTNNYIMTSPDGENWTSRVTPNNIWFDVEYSPSLGLFVAVGAGDSLSPISYIISSTDGVNWTQYSLPEAKNWGRITWAPALGIFLALGLGLDNENNRIMTSPDGENWTTQTVLGDKLWVSVTWTESLNVFVATSANSDTNGIMLSTDGFTWLLQSTPIGPWTSSAWSEELLYFIAVSGASPGKSMLGNVLRVFNSDPLFTYDDTTFTLSVPKITDGTAILQAGTLSNLNEPILAQDSATKNYTDTRDNITLTTVNNTSNSSYTAEEMVNGLITRIGDSSTLVDLTATAVDIIAAIEGPVINSRAYFSVKNDTTDTGSVILVVPNLGVSFDNNQQSIVLPRSYQTNVEIIVDNLTTGSEAVRLLVLNTTFINDINPLGNFEDYTKVSPLIYENYIFENRISANKKYISHTDSSTVTTDSNHTYTSDEVLGGFIIRGSSLTANRFDMLPLLTSFDIDTDVILTSVPFVIKNVDPLYNITLLLGNGWINEPSDGFSGSTKIIPPGYTGNFILEITGQHVVTTSIY
jgi:hypothetical protein